MRAVFAIAIAGACAAPKPAPAPAPASAPASAPAPVTIVLPCAPPPDAAPIAAAPAAAASDQDDGGDPGPVPVGRDDPSWGSRTAFVTIVEFADFQCPVSRRVATTLAELRKRYGPDQLRIVWKNNPLSFHQQARPAAEAAMGVYALAGADAFWRFHDTAFANLHELAADRYEQWAADAGVRDLAAFRDGLASHRWAPVVDADLEDAARADVSGAPIFFIDGLRLEGAQPLEKFTRMIDDELAAARAR